MCQESVPQRTHLTVTRKFRIEIDNETIGHASFNNDYSSFITFFNKILVFNPSWNDSFRIKFSTAERMRKDKIFNCLQQSMKVRNLSIERKNKRFINFLSNTVNSAINSFTFRYRMKISRELACQSY